jgi:hypothetical protein
MVSRVALPEVKHCPFCSEILMNDKDECPRCLKIPSKFDLSSKSLETPTAKSTLQKRADEAWQDLLDNFSETTQHQAFVSLCHQLGHLDFAEERYQKLRDIIGDDHEIDKRLQQINFLRWQSQKVKTSDVAERPLTRWQWQVIVGIVATVLILIGTLASPLRWLASLGLFLVAGLFLNSLKK